MIGQKKLLEKLNTYNIDNFPRPFNGYFSDLMNIHFGIKEHAKIWRPFNVETEVVSGCKFVFMQHDRGKKDMKWENA